jgi:circadian clock protein KaiC
LRSPAATGITGLDDVLKGGFVRDRVYLIEGAPGSGKTTLALQYLLEGAAQGERVLYVALSESAEEIESVAASHGWSLDGVTVREVVPSEDMLRSEDQYTMFHPAEVELGDTIRMILDDVERTAPSRVVIDSLSELRLLAGSALRNRRQILALKQYFCGRNCTVLLLDDMTGSDRDLQVQSIAHGVMMMDQLSPEYGAERRRLRVLKYRGIKFIGGYHDMTIRTGGIEVFPRVVAKEHAPIGSLEKLPSGIDELDSLLGGGLERGTSTLIVGAAGTGKSSLCAQMVAAAAARGQSAAVFIFDEGTQTLLTRAAGLGIDLAAHIESGRVTVQPVDPAELSPGEFAHTIRRHVEERGVSVVVIDSLNGYLNAMPGERFLIIQLHELLSYLGQRGVATLLVSAHHGLIGSAMSAPIDASYLADAVILMRYFETQGEVRQAISVVKKRGGSHERTIREFRMNNGRIHVGKPLREFRGVLTGVPVYEGLPVRPSEESAT